MRAAIISGLLLTLCLGLSAGCKEQTVPEKAKVVKNDVSRAVTRAAHRAEEMICLESDLECLAIKAKHRIAEAADATADAVDEAVDKLD